MSSRHLKGVIHSVKKILVVDDIPEYIESMLPYLEDEFTILSAGNLDHAIKLVSQDHVDLALIDIVLDENNPTNRDGLVLLKWLKEERPDIPVIIMSAYREFDMAVEALNLGAAYFIRKPISPDELVSIIKKCI